LISIIVVEFLLELRTEIRLDALETRNVESIVLASEDPGVDPVDSLPLLLKLCVLRPSGVDVALDEVCYSYIGLQVIVQVPFLCVKFVHVCPKRSLGQRFRRSEGRRRRGQA
jgi:hypothetical protein